MPTLPIFSRTNSPQRLSHYARRRNSLVASALIALSMGPLFAMPVGAAPQNLPPATLPRLTLQKLRAVLNRPAFYNAHVGVCITALGRVQSAQQFPSRPYANRKTRIVFSRDAQKRFMPASNTKLWTAALALHQLGAKATFSTVLATRGKAEDGVLANDLYLIGGGDPALSSDDLRAMARYLAQSGIRRIAGRVRARGSAFAAETFGGRYPDGWTLDDAIWYYGPEVSALAINRNQIDFTVTGGARPGGAAVLKVEPPDSPLQIKSQVTTGDFSLASKGEEELLHFDRADGSTSLSNVLTISGELAPAQNITDGVAVPDPASWAAQILTRALRQEGVQIDEGDFPLVAATPDYVLARHRSPSVGVLLQRFLKSSDNLYGEMLLRDAGLYTDQKPNSGTEARAHQLLFQWLRQNKIATDALRFTDGSGLSRYNMITPLATTQLLALVETMPDGRALWDALPIAGVDGTLKKRMIGTRAANNARAKTGTFSIASNLSGYVTTRGGTRLAVSLLFNFTPQGDAARQAQNDIFAILADSSL